LPVTRPVQLQKGQDAFDPRPDATILIPLIPFAFSQVQAYCVKMRRFFLPLVALTGCASASVPLIQQSASLAPSGSVAPPASVPKVDNGPLLSRLAAEHLSGFALVSSKVKVAKSAPTLSSDDTTTPAIPSGYVRIVEDLGPVLRISTGLPDTARSDGFEQIDDDWAIDGFISRQALVPVLASAKMEQFSDGTGVLLREGLPLDLSTGNVRPLVSGFPDLPIRVSPDDAHLSFSRPATASRFSSPIGGEPQTCKLTYDHSSDSAATTVRDRADVVKERIAERGKDHPSGSLFDLSSMGYPFTREA
jgi:hypothetical protein